MDRAMRNSSRKHLQAPGNEGFRIRLQLRRDRAPRGRVCAGRSGGLVNAGFVNMTIPGGAGGLYSTTEDLLKWERSLMGGKVLSAASLQQMTTPFKDDYAFGLLVRTERGRKQIWHNGGIDGFNTSMAYYPD